MANKVFALVGAALLAAIAFGAGYWWRLETLGQLDRFTVNAPLSASASGQTGVLPKGTTLYQYRAMGEGATYIVFVNLKERDVLAPHASGTPFNLIAPLSTYVAGEAK